MAVGVGAITPVAGGDKKVSAGMKIGEVAKATGLTRKTIRYYEELELLPEPARTESGYRVYGDDAISRLKFITKGRRLGLSLAEIGTVLDLHGQTNYPCPHVLALLDRKLAEIESVLADLNSFRDELGRLRESSAKRLDEVPEGEVVCGIIEQGIHHEGELALAWLEGRNLTGSR